MTAQRARRYMALNFYGKVAFVAQKDTIETDHDPADIKKAAKEERRLRLADALRNNLQKRKQQARSRPALSPKVPTPKNSADSEE